MNTICSVCGANLSMPDSAIGRTVRCPKCRAQFTVRDANEPENPVTTEPIAAPSGRKTGPRSNQKIVVGAVIGLAALLLLGCPCGGVTIWRVFFHRSPSERVLDQWAEGIEKRQEEVKGGKDGPIPIGQAPDDHTSERPEAIRNHTWWRKPITQADLDRILNLFVDANTGDTIFIDDVAMAARDKPDRDTALAFPEGEPLIYRPYRIKATCLLYFISSASHRRRIDRDESLRILISLLDAAELRDGPGRGANARQEQKEEYRQTLIEQAQEHLKELQNRPNARAGDIEDAKRNLKRLRDRDPAYVKIDSLDSEDEKWLKQRGRPYP